MRAPWRMKRWRGWKGFFLRLTGQEEPLPLVRVTLGSTTIAEVDEEGRLHFTEPGKDEGGR